MTRAVRRPPRVLDRERTLLLVIDVQEAYRRVLFEYERVARAVAILLQSAEVLRLPVLVTEQHPQGIGHTVAEVAAHLPLGTAPIEKRTLSCCGTPGFMTALRRESARHQVIVAGIEAHACVNQTAHDLMVAGYEVHVPYDATSSRHASDYRIAWEKMRGSGIVPTSVECALLELVETADAPEFKAIQRLIK